MSEHGFCPNCGDDLDGGLVWEHFYNEFTEGKGYWLDANGDYIDNRRILSHEEAELAADKVAKNYGATRTKGRWGKAIALYDAERDRTYAFLCPSCHHEWKRNDNE